MKPVTVADLERAIDEYLTYLKVERGLSPATIRAYRTDLADYAASRGVGRAWAGSPDAAIGYLAARTRRGRPGDPGLAPSSLRRRAAALKGFYRFAYGEGLIRVDVAAHLDLPRPSRLLPEALTVAETERLLEATGSEDAPQPRALRDRALLELLYAAGLRISEATGLDREDLSTDGAFVRVIGKGDKERLVPVGEVALDWLARWTNGPRPVLLAIGHVAPDRGGRSSWAIAAAGSRGSRLGLRSNGPQRGPAWPTGSALTPPPFVRNAPARGRCRPAGRPGVARSCEYLHHTALHASHRGAHPGRLQPGPPAGLREAWTI